MDIIIVITAFAATILGSISGIGGGVIIKPVMDAIVDMSAESISFLSGTTVLTMTIVSLLRSRSGGTRIDKRGTMLAIGGAFGGLIGKIAFSSIAGQAANPALVPCVQNIIMVVLTAAVFFYVLFKSRIATKDIQNQGASGIIGFILGVISSFLGIGGGPINIMLLSYCFSMDSKTAALTSLYIIFFSQSVSFISTAISGFPAFNLPLLVLMMMAAVAGATIGRGFSKRMSGRGVDILFMCMLAGITGISLYNAVRFAVTL